MKNNKINKAVYSEVVSNDDFTIYEININLSYSEKMNLLLNYNSALLTADNYIIKFLQTQNCDFLIKI